MNMYGGHRTRDSMNTVGWNGYFRALIDNPHHPQVALTVYKMFCLQLFFCILLEQRGPTLLLAIYCPVGFYSNLKKAHPTQQLTICSEVLIRFETKA